MEPRNLAKVLLELGPLPPSVLGSIKVRTRHLGHKKKLFKMGMKSARSEMIMVDGERMSVEHYFKRSKSISRATWSRRVINDI
jgi:eukaryotic translation initiation factor 2C